MGYSSREKWWTLPKPWSSIVGFYLVTILAFLSLNHDVESAGDLYTGAVLSGFTLTALITVLALENR